MAKRPVIEQHSILIVEGVDEQGVFGALLRHLGISDVQVVPTGGKTSLADGLHGLKVSPGFDSVTAIGVVRDADADPEAAFRSVCGALSREGLPVPAAPLVPHGGPPKVTVLILPSGTRPGALEDLCLDAVADDPAFPCVSAYFACLHDAGVDGPHNLSRARMQVFLASRQQAGKRLGEAASYLPWNAPAFDEVRRFVQSVRGHSPINQI
ncbi:MAG: hypothetical protein FJ291_24655 [Planctomycetes bacterium]|nr:hypothetical protein [Planctomycetota bacterium]